MVLLELFHQGKGCWLLAKYLENLVEPSMTILDWFYIAQWGMPETKMERISFVVYFCLLLLSSFVDCFYNQCGVRIGGVTEQGWLACRSTWWGKTSKHYVHTINNRTSFIQVMDTLKMMIFQSVTQAYLEKIYEFSQQELKILKPRNCDWKRPNKRLLLLIANPWPPSY